MTTSSISDALSSLGLGTSAKERTSKKELGQADFLTLLLAQLKNQSPLETQNSSEFASQLAQFGSVSSLQELQASFKDLSSSLLSNQSLQASSLVGRSVATTNSTAILDSSGKGSEGTLVLDKPAQNIQVAIKNSQGETVKTLSLGNGEKGHVDFHWDGTGADGKAATPGTYQITAIGNIENQATALNVAMASKIKSLTVGNNGAGMTLSLENGSQISFNDVIKIF